MLPLKQTDEKTKLLGIRLSAFQTWLTEVTEFKLSNGKRLT